MITKNNRVKNKNTKKLVLNTASVLLIILITFFLLLSLFSYSSLDAGWNVSTSSNVFNNTFGFIGAYSASFILSIFGVSGFCLPFLGFYLIWLRLAEKKYFSQTSIALMLIRTFGIILITISACGLSKSLFSFFNTYLPQDSGGIIGDQILNYINNYINLVASLSLLFVAFLIGVSLFSGISIVRLTVSPLKYIVFTIYNYIKNYKNKKNNLAKLKKENSDSKDKIKTIINLKGKKSAKENANISVGNTDDIKEYLKEKNDSIEAVNDNNLTEKDDANLLENNQNIEHINELNEEINTDNNDLISSEVFTEELSNRDGDDIIENEEIEPENIYSVAPSDKTEEETEEEHISFNPEINSETIDHNNATIENNVIKKKELDHNFKDVLPPLSLLEEPEVKVSTVSIEHIEKMSAMVEKTLSDFGIQVKVVATHPGPVITRYELELAPGTKVSKLSGLSQDLSRGLSTTKVRIVEVIPGKPYVGLELPNEKRSMVKIKEVLATEKFLNAESPITMGLGVNINGAAVITDLAKMPHLLVAGTTGSGKSVGVNSMIISMLYKASPEDLRLILIDPKMLELSIYADIPHLLTPVVTDMNDASNALRWCIQEMERRYEIMSLVGVRNINSLNSKIKEKELKGETILDPLWLKLNPNRFEEAPSLKKMPLIVVVADEFADMIMTVGKKVEELIARLAQKARAAGIHLILATQRPSVDVVTGLIKANIPTRISFQVSSKIDSRTILDQQGAEQLLGNGDMLFLKPGTGIPLRIHGAFVSDDEVHRVVESWKKVGSPEYITDITSSDDENSSNSNDNRSNHEKDALYDEAVAIVLETQRASISGVQRRLRIGYNRAARLIEEMESEGLVSEMQSNGTREIIS